MWELERFDWGSLRSARSAAALPDAIETLRTADTDDLAKQAYWRIDNEVVVQGELFEAAFPTACCLIAALGSCTEASRARIVELLFQLATGTPHSSEVARGAVELHHLCRREVLRAAPLIFESFERAPPASLDLWVDLLIVFSEEDKSLAPRVQWYLGRARRLEVHAGLRESLQRAIADLQGDGLPDQRSEEAVTNDFKKLENDILAILAALQDTLDDAETKEVRDFVEPGEYGVAFETLCSILGDKHAQISPAIIDKLTELGQRMGIDEETWRGLAKQKDVP